MLKNTNLKKIGLLSILLISIFTLTGCTNKNVNNPKSNSKSDDSFKVFEYIEKLEPKNTVEEINDIIGKEGKLTDETNNVYLWEISDTARIEARYGSKKTDNCTISVELDNQFKVLKDKNVDFSKYEEIKKALNTKESITYDEMVQKIGAEGYIMKKTSISTHYQWVNAEGGYLTAYFDPEDGKCDMITGRF